MFNHFPQKKTLQPNAVAGPVLVVFIYATVRANTLLGGSAGDADGDRSTRCGAMAFVNYVTGCDVVVYTQTVLMRKPAFSSVVWAVSKSPATLVQIRFGRRTKQRSLQ